MYEKLLSDLDTLRQQTARFRRVTLHLHSPDSKDWARNGDKELNCKDKFFTDNGVVLFLNELRPHFDMVGVTDHMKCGYACKLSRATAGADDCIVLPGMEVNFKPDAALGAIRIHLVVILPQNSTKEDFAKIFPASIPSDDQRTGNEDVEGVDIREFTKRVHDLDGICIAAHVESDQGIRRRFRQTAVETLKLFSDEDGTDIEKQNDVQGNLKEYLIQSGIDAVEIHTADKSCHYRWQTTGSGQPFWIPTLLTSDAHCVEDFARENRVTHIKMTERSIKGLKDAMDFPETRIRFPENLPVAPNPRLLGIQIKGTDDSFFEDVTVAFAENLNCLIGVRGSGKSTLVEALRYAFGYNRTLGEIGKSLEVSIREMQQANLAGCNIRIVYQTTDEQIRVLQTTFDSKEDYSTKVYTSDGDFIDVPDVEKSGDFPLRLYGWSEIETLGREPSKQRDLLDRLIPEIAPAIQRREDVRSQLRTNRAVIQQHLHEVQNAYVSNDGVIRRFREYKADFDKQNTPDVKTIFSALDVANEKRTLLKQLKTNAESVIEELKELGALSVQSDLEEMLEAGSQQLRDWWHGEGSKRLNISATELDVQKLLKQVVDGLKSFMALTTDHIAECDAKLLELQRELKEQFSENDSVQRIADLRANAAKRLEAVASLRQEYQKKWKALMDALVSRKEISARLEEIQNEIAGIRAKKNAENEETMNGFLPDAMKVTVDFRPGRDTHDFMKILYKLFTNKSKQLRGIQRIIAAHVTPIEFAKMLGTGDFSALLGKTVTMDDGDFTFGGKEAAVCKEQTFPFEDDESADVKILTNTGDRLNVILDVQETPWDDYETILLNGGPVNEKSPGQRSSAMLPLIALAERTPLVIDQPEDNLDKRLIGRVLTKVLAELKERRQIIVCTHDPNILVGGDAEQVIVLDAVSDKKGNVTAHGSIDNGHIVETVIELLEGGADAFRSRSKRYRGRAGLG